MESRGFSPNTREGQSEENGLPSLAAQTQCKGPLADEVTETDEMYQNAGKKEADIPLPTIRRVGVPISNAGMARGIRTVRPCGVSSVDTPVRCICGLDR